MALHSRRPPTPPAPEFYISGPRPPETAETPARTPSELVEPREPAPERPSIGEPRKSAPRPARTGADPGWHQSEPWAVVMLVSFAIMLAAIYVPGTVKLVLVGLSAITAIAGIVLLVRRGVFDHPATDD